MISRLVAYLSMSEQFRKTARAVKLIEEIPETIKLNFFSRISWSRDEIGSVIK